MREVNCPTNTLIHLNIILIRISLIAKFWWNALSVKECYIPHKYPTNISQVGVVRLSSP